MARNSFVFVENGADEQMNYYMVWHIANYI